MISRSVIEQALIPSSCGCARVSMMRGEVVAPGMVSTEPDDLTGSPVDGPAIDGSGAVLSIDGHRIFIPYAPSVPQELAERVEQAVQQATSAQEATNSTHVVAESADIKAEAAIEGVSAVEAAVEAAVQRIDAAQATADTAATEAGQALQGLAEAVVASSIEYAVGTSATIPPDVDTGGWSTDTPNRAPGEYIWQRVRVTRADESWSLTAPVLVTGNAGPQGDPGTSVTIKGSVATAVSLPSTGNTAGDGWITEDDGHLHVWSGTAWVDAGVIRGPEGEAGRGVDSTVVRYKLSASGTTPPAEPWQETPPVQTEALPYLWTRTVTTYTDGSTSTAYSVARRGDKGDQGVSIVSVTPHYYLTDAASTPPTPSGATSTGWSTTEPGYSAGLALWRSERILLSSGSYVWTTPQKSSAYAAAVHIGNLNEQALQGLVKVSQTDPGHYPGRIWWQTDATGKGIGIKVSVSGAWVPYMLVADQLLVPSSIGSVLIANGAITAPKLHVDALNFKVATGMELTAGKVIGARVATADTGPRVEMDPQRLARYRDDREGGLIRTVNIGGDDADELALYDSQGRLLSGLMADGSGVVRNEMSVGALRVGGDRLEDLLNPAPKGVLAYMRAVNDSDRAGSGLLGYIRLGATIRSDRMYRMSISGMLAAATAGDRAYVQLSNVSRGIVLNAGNFDIPTTTARHVTLEAVFPGDINASQAFGVLFRNATANRAIFWSGRSNYPVTAYIEDLGPTAFLGGSFDRFGLTPLSSGTNDDETGAQSYTTTYNAAWTRSWRGGTVVSDFLHHGYYGGLQRYSMAGFGGTLATDLSGATIVKAEVYLDNDHWWGSTGEALIGATTHTSAPASAVTSGTTVASSGWPVGAARWVDITSVWTTAMRAITLGVGAGTGTNRYGKFLNSGVQLRVTYRK